MPLTTKVTILTFDESESGATATVTRTLTRAAIGVLAPVTGDVHPLHIDSYEKRARQDGKKTQSFRAEAFEFPVLNTRLPDPGMKIIAQDLHLHGTIAVGDKLTAGNLVKGKDYFCNPALKNLAINPQKARRLC
jgi:phosphate acetyltransferase